MLSKKFIGINQKDFNNFTKNYFLLKLCNLYGQIIPICLMQIRKDNRICAVLTKIHVNNVVLYTWEHQLTKLKVTSQCYC